MTCGVFETGYAFHGVRDQDRTKAAQSAERVATDAQEPSMHGVELPPLETTNAAPNDDPFKHAKAFARLRRVRGQGFGNDE